MMFTLSNVAAHIQVGLLVRMQSLQWEQQLSYVNLQNYRNLHCVPVNSKRLTLLLLDQQTQRTANSLGENDSNRYTLLVDFLTFHRLNHPINQIIIITVCRLINSINDC